MPDLPPLSHHAILQLVEPFARQGLQLDLAASDRLQRRLRFRAVEHPAAVAGAPAWRESLRLEGSSEAWWTLTRNIERLDLPAAPRAAVVSAGASPAALLAAVQSVDALRAFDSGPGWATACSYWLPPGSKAAPTMTGGHARVGHLDLDMTVPSTSGVAASIVLTPPAPRALTLPEDLLAVLGWNWSPLQRAGDGWKTRVRLRRRDPGRTADAEAALHKAAAHLARTLAAPPARFHDLHRRARWGVVLRRFLPTLTALSLLVTVALLPRLGLESIEGPWVLLYHLPTLLLAAAFMLQEMPRFEIPPLPRRSAAGDWTPAPGPPRGGADIPKRTHADGMEA
jgi:hypothetical protein